MAGLSRMGVATSNYAYAKCYGRENLGKEIERRRVREQNNIIHC